MSAPRALPVARPAPSHARDLALLRLSLAATWLATAAASAIEARGQSARLLALAGIRSPGWQAVALWGGVAWDTLVGLALAAWPRRRAVDAALASMLALTAVASLLLPSMWLHPLGPLLKNLPIGAALVVLRRNLR